MKIGNRAWKCALTTMHSTLHFAGMRTAAAYFDQDSEEENEISRLADELYRRADWQWATGGGATLSHGWRPERGVLKSPWDGYDGGMLGNVLALGSPQFPLPPEGYPAGWGGHEGKEVL